MLQMQTAISAWASRFFSGENKLEWGGLLIGADPDGWAAEIFPWLSLIDRGDPDLPMVLPCLDNDRNVTWYGAARSAKGTSQLGEELRAFIGPSYSDFSGRPNQVSGSDLVAAVLRDEFSQPIYRFKPTKPQDVQTIRRAIILYRSLLERRPPSTRFAAKPLGAIRSQFDRALLAGDEPEARRRLDEMLATGRLSFDNRVFLEVRLLAGLCLWQQIAGDGRLLRSLADLPLPARILTDVVEALYRVYAEPSELNLDVAGALRRFKDAGVGRLSRIFSTRRGVNRPRVVKAFLLYELLRAEPDWKYFQSMIELLDDATHAPFISALNALFPNREGRLSDNVHAVGLSAADDAFDNNEYDRALQMYKVLQPTPRAIRRLITCAKAIGSNDAAKSVLEIIESQTTDVLPRTETLTLLIAQLQATVSLVTTPHSVHPTNFDDGFVAEQTPIVDWSTWARYVASVTSVSESEAVLQQCAATWSADGLANDPSKVADIATALGKAPAELVKAAFPYLFQAFIIDAERPVSAYKPLYETLLTLVALAEPASQDDLELTVQLTENLLTVGVSVNEYNAIILDLSDLLKRHRSIASLSWALDIAEVLSFYPSPDVEARLRFFTAVLDMARSFVHRLDAVHFEAINLLCKDLEISPPSEFDRRDDQDIETESQYSRLVDKHIAIYTLTKQAGMRASTIISRLCPTSKVSLNSDPVCTEQLTALARKADIFVFAWKSSKHQAFYCVKNQRPKELPFLQPLGKGSASILRALFEE